MFKYLEVMFVAIGLIGLPAAAFAGDFDGSMPLSGTIGKVIEINQYKITDDIDPDTVGLPKRFLIDFKARVIHPSNDSMVRRKISIDSVAVVENKTVLQGVDEGIEGVEDGLAWSLTISQKDGRAVLAASGNGMAYVVFGACRPIEENP
jgi:hypothetical protein